MKRYTDELPPYDTSDMEELIRQKVHNKRARAILTARLCDELTYSEISRLPEVDRTERQVGYVLSKWIPRIAKYL